MKAACKQQGKHNQGRKRDATQDARQRNSAACAAAAGMSVSSRPPADDEHPMCTHQAIKLQLANPWQCCVACSPVRG